MARSITGVATGGTTGCAIGLILYMINRMNCRCMPRPSQHPISDHFRLLSAEDRDIHEKVSIIETT